MAITRKGPALQCRECVEVFWDDPAEEQRKKAHAARCGGEFRRGIRTIYKYCPEGGASHDRGIITKGETEMSHQTKCGCGKDLKERDVFSPTEP